LADDPRTRYALAERVEAERSRILADYLHTLDSLDSTVASDPTAREQTIAHASQSLTDLARSVRAGRVQIDEGSMMLAWDIGETRAAQAIPTRESWRAAMVFVETVMQWVIHHVDADSLETLGIVLLTLNQSITVRVREATGAYTSFLLKRIHEAHLGERQRIARELHDRVGDGLSLAHRRLELLDDQIGDPVKAATQAKKAHQAVLESLESLRAVITDLRLEAPLKSLEKALASYIDSIPSSDGRLWLRVNGDENWVPTAVREESFLIIREAIRNSLAHGAPGRILIRLDIAPHELRAVVEDTGRGFDHDSIPASATAGLSSMRERAALLGGVLLVASQAGHGTSVELTVPLPEQRSEGDLACRVSPADDVPRL
jgi:signal transduction histidine kinase